MNGLDLYILLTLSPREDIYSECDPLLNLVVMIFVGGNLETLDRGLAEFLD